jgi:hypothetical protein
MHQRQFCSSAPCPPTAACVCSLALHPARPVREDARLGGQADDGVPVAGDERAVAPGHSWAAGSRAAPARHRTGPCSCTASSLTPPSPHRVVPTPCPAQGWSMALPAGKELKAMDHTFKQGQCESRAGGVARGAPRAALPPAGWGGASGAPPARAAAGARRVGGLTRPLFLASPYPSPPQTMPTCGATTTVTEQARAPTVWRAAGLPPASNTQASELRCPQPRWVPAGACAPPDRFCFTHSFPCPFCTANCPWSRPRAHRHRRRCRCRARPAWGQAGAARPNRAAGSAALAMYVAPARSIPARQRL